MVWVVDRSEPDCEQRFLVSATAYNAVEGQTLGDPRETAWGHRLRAGDRVVAVSRDLIEAGLIDGVAVHLRELDASGSRRGGRRDWEGEWVVRDKMARRWRNKIDLFFGTDQRAALEFGRRDVEVCFSPQVTEP